LISASVNLPNIVSDDKATSLSGNPTSRSSASMRLAWTPLGFFVTCFVCCVFISARPSSSSLAGLLQRLDRLGAKRLEKNRARIDATSEPTKASSGSILMLMPSSFMLRSNKGGAPQVLSNLVTGAPFFFDDRKAFGIEAPP